MRMLTRNSRKFCQSALMMEHITLSSNLTTALGSAWMLLVRRSSWSHPVASAVSGFCFIISVGIAILSHLQPLPEVALLFNFLPTLRLSKYFFNWISSRHIKNISRENNKNICDGDDFLYWSVVFGVVIIRIMQTSTLSGCVPVSSFLSPCMSFQIWTCTI